MTNNDILRRLRYAFDFSDTQMIALFQSGALTVTREQVSDWMRKEDAPTYQPCESRSLAAFLNGLINERRGKREGAQPAPESTLTNNVILRKLKIALELEESDLLELMSAAGLPLSRPELSALFRKPDNRHYRVCQDQILRRFIQGVQLKYRQSAEE